MKPLITILKIFGTFVLSVIIIPLMLCTMTLYSVSHFVTPEYLTDVIKTAMASSMVPDTDDILPDDASAASNSNAIKPLSNVSKESTLNTEEGSNLIEIMEGLKIDIESGMVYIGETGSIDVSATGIADVPGLADIEPTEENIQNILANEEIISVFLEYIGDSLMDYINGEELPDITAEQFEKLTTALLDGIESEFGVEIPDDVKKNVTSEVSKNNSEISSVLREQVPTVDEIKQEYCVQNGIDPELLDNVLTAVTTAVTMLFNNTLFYLSLGAVIFIAILILLINLRKLNGLLVVGILGIVNGLLFAAIGILGNTFAPDLIMSGATELANSNDWIRIVTDLFNTIKMTGLVAVIISVALIVIKIVVGNIVMGRIKHNTTSDEATTI